MTAFLLLKEGISTNEVSTVQIDEPPETEATVAPARDPSQQPAAENDDLLSPFAEEYDVPAFIRRSKT